MRSMKCLPRLVAALGCTGLLLLARGQDAPPPTGPGKVVVHSAFGGFILGYDIDATGDEGMLSEAVPLADGRANVAVETFDQKSGKIVKVIHQQTDSYSDYVTLGIFGHGVGLTEIEHAKGIYVDKRTYRLSDPVDANRFTGSWSPPSFHAKDDILSGADDGQGYDTAVFLGFVNDAKDFHSYVFSSDVAANTFGPRIQVTDDQFSWDLSPVIALDQANGEAILGGGRGCFGCSTAIGRVNLTTGAQSTMRGLGLGTVNGIAVDPVKQIVCTTTEDDFSVEFYDLVKGTSRLVVLPGATSQAQSGGAVAVDAMHHLFLVGQEFSSTASSGSSIQVFDEQGNFVESLNGFSLPASPAYMALNPAQRRGFVIITPQLEALQSFTY